MNYLARIRNLREDHDYTQTYVASVLNVGQRTYADYELGKTRIPLDSMIKLAKLAQIGVISAPICAFCRRSLGGFSVVSIQTCPLQFYSGSKVGQVLPFTSIPVFEEPKAALGLFRKWMISQ